MDASYRVLVVDDEPGVRRNLTRLLRGCRFATEEAADGQIASEIIRNGLSPLDLLVTDVVMPGMSGLELAQLTMALSPTTKILLISAYVPAQTLATQALPYLQKPFHLNVFLRTVVDLLKCPTPPQSFPIAG